MSDTDSTELSVTDLKRAIQLIHRFTGITMSETKKTLIQGRLNRRLRELKLPTYAVYMDYLEATAAEVQEFINVVTTNETTFFRTPRLWEHFTKAFLPEWQKAHPMRALRIWSGASSTGEEVYTIAMNCSEFKESAPGFDFTIQATDIDTKVLAAAEKGSYTGRSIALLQESNPAFLKKYMIGSGDSFQMRPDLKGKIKFQVHNLFQPSAQENFDVVFLRNVLIYFGPQDQERVLAHVHRALAVGGHLVIGESESLSSLKTGFEFVSPLIYKKAA